MRNLKKLLAVIVSVCVLATFALPAFAAETTALKDAEICEDLGVVKGDSSQGVTDDYLAKGTTRLQAAIIYLRMLDLEDEALAYEGEDNFDDAADVAWAGGKAILAYLKANPDLGWQGVGGNKFDPNGPASAQMMYKVALEALGYKQDAEDGFKWADVFTFADDLGLGKVADVTELTNNDMCTVVVEMLGIKVKDGDKTLIEKLVADGVVTEEAAEAAGLVSGAVALDVKSAVALNSKIVEVSLNTAATAKDLAAATFAVKDADAKEVAVAGAEFAPWSTNNKSVLVTLGDDTTSGTLYTMTAGEKSINFGGKAKDTTKPKIADNGVESTDYNQVKVTFTEPVLISGATFAIAEKYGSKAALEITSVGYDSSTAVLLSTADQKDATLYGIEVAGAVDLAGNTMDKDSDKNFNGTKKNDSDLEVVTADGTINPEEVTVRFNARVDAATIAAANFKVEEMYGSKAVIEVTGARIGVKDEEVGIGKAKLVNSVASDNDAQKHVVLSIPGVKDSTLYKVTVTGLKSAYGKDLSSTDSKKYTTFSALKKPADAFTYLVTGGIATSNTTIEVEFANKVAKEDAENIANYAIAEAYGNKDALTITKAELQTGDKKVKLTVNAMKSVLYKITITNVKDIYGNSIKTADSVNIVSFSGQSVASKISRIVSIGYATGSDTVIEVSFDQNVGSSATDVSHYVIDGGVGYPEQAAKHDDANKVKLTIPKLTVDKVYKLTVKGLENADGVAMDSDGVSLTFIGKGNAATAPELVAVMAIDKQTLKIYFDRDVKDSSIDGVIWDKSTNALISTALTYEDKALSSGTTTLEDLADDEVAFQDPSNKNVLIVRIAGTNGNFAPENKNSAGSFKLVGDSTLFAKDKNSLVFSPNGADVAPIEIESVMALNKSTIRVYFTQPVFGTLNDFAKVCNTNDFTDVKASLSNATAFGSTRTIYDFALDTDLESKTYYLVVDPALTASAVLSDSPTTNKFVTLKDEDTSKASLQHTRQFAGSGTTAGDIKDVSVLMLDEKTILVYYPQIMDTSVTGTNGSLSASVLDFDNYEIVDADGAPVTMNTSNVAFDNKTDIGEIKYDSDDKSDTYNTAKIVLNKTIKTATGGAFLKFANTTTPMKNATATASVKDGDNVLKRQFAISTGESAKVEIKEASYDRTAKTLKIKFKQKVTSANDLSAAGAEGTEFANLLAALKLTFKVADVDYPVVGTDVSTVSATLATAADEITITFVGGFAPDTSAVGKVEFAATPGLTGINGNAVKSDSSVTFAQ